MSTEAAPPDLLILDLEIPYEGGEAILEKLTERAPLLPVVIHTFPSEFSMNGLLAGGRATVVEKSGNTDSLKNAVLEMLRKAYPDRFERLNKGKQMQSHGHI